MTLDPLVVYGTEEPVPERRVLRAGSLSAVLEDGQLRDIRFGGIEVIRAIGYLVRDASWGTLPAEVEDLAIREGDAEFEVTYAGTSGVFHYRMRIQGTAAGRLSVEAEGEARADFETNRTGFVVLHPAEVAGGELLIRHGDGALERTVFPARISPDQPAFDIAGLTHRPARGMTCEVAFAGDQFEMEDQRNWADASFKTYVRPLSRPRPYVIAKGVPDRQSVRLRIQGATSAPASRPRDPVEITVGGPAGTMPAMGLFVDEAGIGRAAASPGLAQILIPRLDIARGVEPILGEAARFARACGAEVAVELVCDLRDPEAEARDALGLIAEAGLAPAALLCSARREFRTRPSGTLPDGEHPVGRMVDALREAGFAGRIGAGTPSNFTEFNRCPPDRPGDFTYFGVSANVHAADDRAVMETLEVYPELIASARALCPDTPIWLGPCGIGVRHNPYGAAVQANPDHRRVAAARVDPRHKALFGATYAVSIAAAIAGQVETLTLAAPAGDFGLFHSDGRATPIHHAQRLLARAAGAARRRIEMSDTRLTGLAFQCDDRVRLLIANTRPEPVELAPPRGAIATLLGEDRPMTKARGVLRLPAHGTVVLDPPGAAPIHDPGTP